MIDLKELGWVAALSLIVACGDANAGELGPSDPGGGAEPLSQVRTFELVCDYADLELVLAVDLAVILDEAFRTSGSNEVTFAAGVTLVEESVQALIDASVTMIDVSSMSVTTKLAGASPSTMTSVLNDTPIDNFDLTADPDDSGAPGPHRFQLTTVTETASVEDGNRDVVFTIDDLRFAFGDFRIPEDCAGGRSLSGVPITFRVQPN